ncbi:MAG TPA: CopL family metal-binding regulatory protein [Pseudoxanthomonas sp.]
MSHKNIDNTFNHVLLLWYRQLVARLSPMPSIRLLLRIFLILVLCADGTTGAWAATRMATNQASQANQASAGAKSKSGCDTDNSHDKTSASAPTAPASGQDQHDDCDCGSDASCACGCMLTFHPGRTAPLFAAQHALMSVHPAQPLLPVVPTQVSRLFRPPIY